MEPNLKLAKKLNIGAWVITILVLICVGMMRRVELDWGVDFSFLPPVYSALNALTAIILIVAYVNIKNKQVETHRKLMMFAVVSSFLFLSGYVLYHITTPETLYGGEGVIRFVYFFFLITHIVLAAIIFPFILFTFIKAYTNQIDKHRKLARWVFPIWLYVALTGPVIYLMLMPYYPK